MFPANCWSNSAPRRRRDCGDLGRADRAGGARHDPATGDCGRCGARSRHERGIGGNRRGAGSKPAIEWAEPNYTFTLDATPNDPYYPTNQAPYLNRLEMPAAWDYTTGQSDIIIAVLDTGVSTDHPDLASGIWTNSKEISGDSGIDDDGNGFIDDVHGWNFPDGNNQIYDDHGHGTHVAGIAAARINNGVGIAGMAGGATIMPVRCLPAAERDRDL